MRLGTSLQSALLASTLIIAGVTGALADSVFAQTGRDFSGDLRGNRNDVVLPGGKGWVTGRRMTEGQQLTFRRGDQVLNDEPLVVGADGKFEFAFDLPQDAAIGQQPIVVTAANPDGAGIMMLKVSPQVPLSGQDGFDISSAELAKGLYQVARNKDGKLFVAAADGRGDKAVSKLFRLDGATLAVEAEASPPAAADGTVNGVFGLGLDDAHGTVWTTNTLTDTITVFRQDDLSVLRAFPEGTIAHPRDVVVDAARNRVYVNAALTPEVQVYDGETLERVGTLAFPGTSPREMFGSMSLAFDAGKGRLYSASRPSGEVAWVDVETGEGGAFKPENADFASGVAFDPETNRLFVTSQNSDNLLVLDADSGKVLADTPIGAGSLNVVFDPSTRHAYAVSRAAGTLTVLDVDGQIVANLPVGKLANYVITDGAGTVYALSMTSEGEGGKGLITRITAR